MNPVRDAELFLSEMYHIKYSNCLNENRRKDGNLANMCHNRFIIK